MKKIFSLPSISIHTKNKQPELYSHNVGDLIDNSTNLTDEKRVRLEKLQTRLNFLYEELDKVMTKEEELIVLNYRNKKRKIEPISNFKNSLESLEALKSENRSSSSKSLFTNNLKDDYVDSDEEKLNEDNQLNLTLGSQILRDDLSSANRDLKDEIFENDKLDYNSNYNDLTCKNAVNNTTLAKFYFPLSESKQNSQLDVTQTQSSSHFNEVIDQKLDNQLDKQSADNLSISEKSDFESERNVIFSNLFNVIKQSKPINSSNLEQDGNSLNSLNDLVEQTSLPNEKIDFLKQRLSYVVNENHKLQSLLEKAIESEKEMILNNRRLEEKILDQREKIEQMQSRLIESTSSHNKLKEEHEQFKIEMQVERERFTSFVTQEMRRKHCSNEEALQQKLQEKDQLIANLTGEMDNLKMNLKNKCITIDLVEKNKLLSSQQINLDQTIRNISVYQTDHTPEFLMINLDDNSSQSSDNFNNRLTDDCRNNVGQSNSSNRSGNQLKCNSKSINETANNSSGQSTKQLNDTLKQFCNQVNLLQKKLSSVSGEDKKVNVMTNMEEFILKNVRKLVLEKVDSFFDSLQLYLAQLKFEIIKFAVENEHNYQQLLYPKNGNNRKSKGSSLNQNNSSLNHKKQLNSGLYNLRNNLQSRIVERRMVELRRSIETYLKSYLVRILLEMQDQTI